MDEFRLDGRLAVVIGSSRGLGRSAALALAKAGADLVLAARNILALEHVAAEIHSETGASAIVEQLDVRSSTEVERFFAAASSTSSIDILVNCAAIERENPIEEFSDHDWDDVLATNLTGTFYCSRAFARRSPSSGCIINFASVAGTVGVSRQAAYCASKAGIVGLTKALAIELGPKHIRVNAIAPGYFETGMPSQILSDPATRQRLLRRVPVRRTADPSEIGPPVVFLASDAARFMTGAVLFFDGGYTAQ